MERDYIRYIYEFIGTFFLVLTVGLVTLDPHNIGLWAPLAIGSILMVMVFAGGHISGGHYNPAVSLAAFIAKKLSSRDLGIYWVVQFVAGIIAALLTAYLKDGFSSHAIEIQYDKAFVLEFLFTFALCYVVLNVAAARATDGNSYFGLAIGFTVLVGAYAIGNLSSAALNPAVALGLSVLKSSAWSNLWVYLIANLLGGAVAAWVFNAAHPIENKEF
ncbi:MIP/aquaporin family protein [Candidatus Protochlamydia phocaeensis]|uniref:MIP/aquaporin family protein n=1 Tax=Candidatus Protochlamydia phocaeensis TaxID=1414722 RepID=UPI000837AABF|nr:aquaporin [Candidatus Protochlamydia phocaeensis]